MPTALENALTEYTHALNAPVHAPDKLLIMLLSRDQVAEVLEQTTPRPVNEVKNLVGLDERFRNILLSQSDEQFKKIATWRKAISSSCTAESWWWQMEKSESHHAWDWVWVSLTIIIIGLIAIGPGFDILRRLLDGTPDSFSIVLAIATIFLTGSPELIKWFLKWVDPPQVDFYNYPKKMFIGSLIMVVIILGVYGNLPRLATWYNNAGIEADRVGNLVLAQQYYQRAIALDPNQVVAYHNLAGSYEAIARPDEAEIWYQQAIERQANFVAAYRGLGHLYNTQGKPQLAEATLLAGLRLIDPKATDKESVYEHYRLLAELGWAYFAQKRYEFAQIRLEDAVALEVQLKQFEKEEKQENVYRKALPHYYLAQIYDNQSRPKEAYREWGDCFRLLQENDLITWEWYKQAKKRLAELEKTLP